MGPKDIKDRVWWFAVFLEAVGNVFGSSVNEVKAEGVKCPPEQGMTVAQTLVGRGELVGAGICLGECRADKRLGGGERNRSLRG